jgi:hypothetical protein
LLQLAPDGMLLAEFNAGGPCRLWWHSFVQDRPT